MPDANAISRGRDVQVTATAFAALFSVVGLALYGLPLYYDFMVVLLALPLVYFVRERPQESVVTPSAVKRDILPGRVFAGCERQLRCRARDAHRRRAGRRDRDRTAPYCGLIGITIDVFVSS
jgi:hypothetical protein